MGIQAQGNKHSYATSSGTGDCKAPGHSGFSQGRGHLVLQTYFIPLLCSLDQLSLLLHYFLWIFRLLH